MIMLDNISFSYDNKVILQDFSLQLSSKATCIDGPSGCGKTTLLRLIAGLAAPQRGQIIGVPDKIAFLFQEDRLLP